MGPEPPGHEEEFLPLGFGKGFGWGGLPLGGGTEGLGHPGTGTEISPGGLVQGELDPASLEEVYPGALRGSRDRVNEGKGLPLPFGLHDPVPKGPEAGLPVTESSGDLESPGLNGGIHPVLESFQGGVALSFQEGRDLLYPAQVLLPGAC